MEITFGKITDYDRGTLSKQLHDAYSFDDRYRQYFEQNWIEYDDFFYDNPTIAENYGLVTLLGDEVIGHISWDPRNRPEYVEIGHNCIISKYKGNGYGKLQLAEAIRRIKQYEKLKKIIVRTNQKLIAPHNYESVGFRLAKTVRNSSETMFAGDYLDYEIIL